MSSFAAALHGQQNLTASMRDVYNAPAILVIGNNPTDEHPLLAWHIRNNVRLHNARLYVVNSEKIKLHRQAASFSQIQSEAAFAGFLGATVEGAGRASPRDGFFTLPRIRVSRSDGVSGLAAKLGG